MLSDLYVFLFFHMELCALSCLNSDLKRKANTVKNYQAKIELLGSYDPQKQLIIKDPYYVSIVVCMFCCWFSRVSKYNTLKSTPFNFKPLKTWLQILWLSRTQGGKRAIIALTVEDVKMRHKFCMTRTESLQCVSNFMKFWLDFGGLHLFILSPTQPKQARRAH